MSTRAGAGSDAADLKQIATIAPARSLGAVMAARESPASLNAIALAFENLPVAVCLASAEDMRIVLSNRTFSALFGYPRTEFKTMAEWVEATYPLAEDRGLAWEVWGACVSGHDGTEKDPESETQKPIDPADPVKIHILCSDGGMKTVVHSCVRMAGTGWVLCSFTDVTPLKPARLRLEASRQALSENWRSGRLSMPAEEALHDEIRQMSAWEALVLERKLVQQSRRLSENLLDRTGALAQVGGWELELATGMPRWTAETYRLHGVPADYQPTLEEAIRFYTPASQMEIRKAIEEAFATGTGYDLEAQLIRADGREITVRVLGTVECVDGKPVRLSGAIQDVTARSAEREKLREAHDWLVLAANSGNIGLWNLSLIEDSMIWDEQMYRLYGLKPKDGVESFSIWSTPLYIEDRARVLDLICEAARGLVPFESEFRIVRPDGTLRHMRASGKVIRDARGRRVRMVGATWDVTESGKANTEPDGHGELLRVTLESIGDGVITTDAMGRVQWMNPVAERLTGWQMLEAEGLPLETVFPLIDEHSRERVESPLQECLAKESTIKMVADTVLLARDGREIGIDDSAAPIRDMRGEILGVVLVFHDVTEQRRAANEAARTLQRDLQMKDEFLSNVSHELRSPLASIYSFGSILADGLAGEMTETQSEYLEIIMRNCRQLRAMIDDLLDVSRSGSGKLQITLGSASVEEAVFDASHTVLGAAESKGVALSTDCPGRLPRVLADPTRLRQVLIILLDNAIKFTPSGGRVSLRAGPSSQSTGLVEFRVSDTGCGIKPEALSRIFEHLYQADQPVDAGRKGLGLGLYIAKDLVERQGGRIWVESEPGQGSEFHFTVPVFSAVSPYKPVD